jgi:O-Antigen ligase
MLLNQKYLNIRHVFILFFYIVIFNGFITNFSNIESISLGTVMIDLFYLLLIFFVLFNIVEKKIYIHKRVLFVYALFILISVLAMLKMLLVDSNPLVERLLGFRNNLYYSLVFILITSLIQKKESVEYFLRLTLKMGIVLCIFAIIQFYFSDFLPSKLLVLKDENVFTFYETTIIRPTGLVGNTIIFGGFLIVLYSITFSCLLAYKKNKYIFYTIIIIFTNILTFSRASIIGMILITWILFILFNPSFLKNFIFLIVSLLVFFLIFFFYNDSFLFQRLLNQEITTKQSTDEHLIEIRNSISSIIEHPFTGVGLGTQGPSGNPQEKIISDGAWFQFLLEYGIPIFSIYIIFIICNIIFAFNMLKKSKYTISKVIAANFIAINSYFFLANFLNSSFSSRIIQILYWSIFGYLLVLYNAEKKLMVR